MFPKKEDTKLKKEEQLLLLCSRTRVDSATKDIIESLVDNHLDWEHLIRMATQHRLIPLLYVNLNTICPRMVPNDVLKILKERFHDNARRNLLLTGELVKIMKLLEENSIKAVTYKGPVLANSIYGNIAYRQFGDIDILTDKKGALKAKNLILSLGYKFKESIVVKTSDYLKLDSEFRFVNEKGITIEINWKFEGMFFSFTNRPDFLLEDLIKVNINNFQIETINPANLFLMLCIHSAKHDWRRLSWICDINELILKETIDWDKTFKKAKQLGIERIININIFLAYELFGLELPKKLSKNFKYNFFVIRISYFIIKCSFLVPYSSLNIFKKFFLDFYKRERIVSSIHDCVKGLYTPTYNDVKDFKLPYFWIYKLIRPFLLIKRYGKKPLYKNKGS